MPVVAVTSAMLLLPATRAIAEPPEFDKDVASVLIRRCLDCHSGADPKGGLDLTRKDAVLGEKGPVTAGKPDASLLWKKVNADEMPPKKPLTVAEKALLKAWIADGAVWGTDPIDPFAITTKLRAGRDWWSLQPIKRPPLPNLPPRQPTFHTDVDYFIAKKLSDNRMSLAPPADRRTLIRRLYFDLVGFPPTFEEIEDFANDKTPNAYRRLIDK